MRTRVVALEAQTGRRERPCCRHPGASPPVSSPWTPLRPRHPTPPPPGHTRPNGTSASTGRHRIGSADGVSEATPTSGTGSRSTTGRPAGARHTSAGRKATGGGKTTADDKPAAARETTAACKATTGRRTGAGGETTAGDKAAAGRKTAVGGKTTTARRATTRPNDESAGTTAHREDAADTADAAGPASAARRRRTVLLLLGLTAVTSATALVLGLLSWAPDPPEPARPMTVAEGERLAAVRVTNLRDLRAGVRVTAGTGASRVELVGWVDWSRALLYLDVGGPGAGAERGLLQRAGPVLMIRPDPAAMPTPPHRHWCRRRTAGGCTAWHPGTPGTGARPAPRSRRRPSGPSGDSGERCALDRPRDRGGRTGGCPPGATARRYVTLGQHGPVGTARGSTAPAGTSRTASTAPGSTAPVGTAPTPNGQTRYWLDQDARLHKLVTRLPDVGPVTMIFNRADRPTLRPVEALGGRPGLPAR
ncbi:hypothetical protein NKG94_48305 [Micromonospora sp. M12]